MSGFRGRVRVGDAVLASRSLRERKVSLFLSEDLVGEVMARASGREWSDGVWRGLHLHDAIRLALWEWVSDERVTAITRAGGLTSLREAEPYWRGLSSVDLTLADRRRRYRRAVQRAEVREGGLFYPFPEG